MRYLMLVLLLGCSSPESRIVRGGGVPPVICHEQDSMTACRDSAGHFWICRDDGIQASCMQVDMPAKIFAVTTVEKLTMVSDGS